MGKVREDGDCVDTTTIPAESGWFYLNPVTDEDRGVVLIDRIPIVAWVITIVTNDQGKLKDKSVDFIAPGYFGEHNDYEILVRPNRRLVTVHGDLFSVQDDDTAIRYYQYAIFGTREISADRRAHESESDERRLPDEPEENAQSDSHGSEKEDSSDNSSDFPFIPTIQASKY